MSKHETPMTVAYWESMGGLLIEEFHAVRRTATNSHRDLDGLIVLGQERHRTRHAALGSVPLHGHDVVVIQTKSGSLETALLGQALFSRELVRRVHAPASVRAVALCGRDDSLLRPLAMAQGIEVAVFRQGYRRRSPPFSLSRPLLQRYWRHTGGLLIQNCAIASATPISLAQVVHGLILAERPSACEDALDLARSAEDGEPMCLVHTVAARPGMYALGQAFFTAELLRQRYPCSAIRTVIACERDDSVMRALADEYGIEIAVMDAP